MCDCELVTIEEVNDEHGHRRWQECVAHDVVRKQRMKGREWVTVWEMSGHYRRAYPAAALVLDSVDKGPVYMV